MIRRHRMPFGAELLREGGVRFRLWAPAARSVDLCLDGAGGERRLALGRDGGGWFSADVAEAGAGSRYRYLIDGELRVPDPAARFQPEDVHGPSEVVDPEAFAWRADDWRGRPWAETVLYELHVGAFTARGDFRGVIDRLDHLAALGVSAIELMPVGHFAGRRNWGYDGVLPFAPDSSYGRPEDLKALVDAAHGRGLMVFLDVVYNHFGPEGNYLHRYAPAFFTSRYHTPWGSAIDFEGQRTVRDFFIHNALYWIDEYFLDGLRLDAVHAVHDRSDPDILVELAEAVHGAVGAERHVHLVLENDNNAARYLRRTEAGAPRWYVAQWNDDIHHAFHVLLTGEDGGYYEDYADAPAAHLGRSLCEGFAYQGEASRHRGGRPRGEPSADLPLTAFVSFLQNHDQVGNRALGERIAALAAPEALRAALAVALLAPGPPLLFMGEEWAAAQPFPFFCDFEGELAASVREGRRREFARFPEFRDARARERIPDPNARQTFESAVLAWSDLALEPHGRWLAYYRDLLRLRREAIVPRLDGSDARGANFASLGPTALGVVWTLVDGSRLELLANLGPVEVAVEPVRTRGRPLFETDPGAGARLAAGTLAPWSVLWFLEPPAPRP